MHTASNIQLTHYLHIAHSEITVAISTSDISISYNGHSLVLHMTTKSGREVLAQVEMHFETQ